MREEAQRFFLQSSQGGDRLVTSAEVLQELLHVYLPAGLLATLDAALELATRGVDLVLPIELESVVALIASWGISPSSLALGFTAAGVPKQVFDLNPLEKPIDPLWDLDYTEAQYREEAPCRII